MRLNNTVLWILQGLMACLFLFAGGMKLVLPIEQLQGPVVLPEAASAIFSAADHRYRNRRRSRKGSGCVCEGLP